MEMKGKKVKVTLNDDAINAFNTLKEKLTSHPVLKLPNLSKPFKVRTDALKHAIGGVLFQRDEKGYKQPV